MKHRCTICVAIAIALTSSALATSDPPDPNRYLDAVQEFGDNALKYGRDTYGPKHTPLFVDGLNIHTHEPVKWIAPNGDRWILSNLASQQNLFRTLDALTTITGDPKYKQAAVDAMKYSFENLRTPNGLLYWGGHSAYDAAADKPCGRDVHELKEFYPYYELMWEVDPHATRQFIEAFWSGHVLDWSNLDFNRHCSLGTQALPKAWDYEYEGGPVFFTSKGGLSFCNTGSDLCYAGVLLNLFSRDEKPLLWSKRLACRYVEARNPRTNISPYVFSGDTGPDTFAFPHYSLSNSTIWPSARHCYMRTPETVSSLVTSRPLCELLLGDILGDRDEDFTRYGHEELSAIGKACYRRRDNVFVPISESGLSLEGHLCTRDDPFGPPGSKLLAIPAQPSDFWAYAAAYRLTNDAFMWEMARDTAQGNTYGDIGASAAQDPQLNYDSTVCDPHGLLGFLELYRKTRNRAFLKMAEQIGVIILSDRFRRGFFVGNAGLIFCKFDTIDSLALLHLYAVTGRRRDTSIPQVWPGTSFFDMAYRNKEEVIDNLIYAQNESPLPLSLQEAAAVGDIDLIRSLAAQGANVDGREDTFLKTGLHHAAMNGHKNTVETLLAQGADVNAKDSFPGGTPLHYAVENGHREVAEVLIANGADVNATRRSPGGDRPLHSATRAGHKDIVELLVTKAADINAENGAAQTALDLALSQHRRDIVELLVGKGADVSVRAASILGDVDEVRRTLRKGADVNAGDEDGRTALHIAAREGYREITELLLAHGADVNLSERRYNLTAAEFAMMANHDEIVELLVSKGADISPLHLALYRKDAAEARRLIECGADVNRRTSYGTAPLDRAANAGFKDIAELLIAKGADVNAEDNWNWTALHTAAERGDEDMVAFLLANGADTHAKDGSGRTPLWYAEKRGQAEIVELLRKHGAKE